MLGDFLVRAALAGVGTAIAAAPLGCFVVWRRMAFFGDATAHAALLGVALSVVLSWPVFAGALLVALAMAAAVTALEGQGHAADTVLGVLSHSALAFGLIAVAMVPALRLDPMSYLLGDILAVSRSDLALIWGGAILAAGLILWRWSALLLVTLDADLARAAGVDPRRERLVLVLALATVVAVAIKVVGALLIAALLIIPPAAARTLARTPEQMALAAVALGVISALGGLAASFQWDTPTGPTIVAVAAALFVVSVMVQAVLRTGGVRIKG